MLTHQRTIALALALCAPVAQSVRPSQGAQAARPFGTQGDPSGAGALGSLLQRAAALKQADEARQQAATAEEVSKVVPEIQQIISDIKGLEAGEFAGGQLPGDLPEDQPVSLAKVSEHALSAEEWASFEEMTGKMNDRVAAAMRQRAGALVQQRDTPPEKPGPNPAAAAILGPTQAAAAAAGQQPASPDAVVAPREAPCTDAVAEVQAAINCSIPPACTKYPPHSTVPEIQLGTQRVLEKCFEFHNACQASAHKFLEIKAMRKLLMAKIQMMKTEVESANKQFHERVIRLVEKNQTIHMINDGVKEMNSTANSLQGSSVEFPGNDTHFATGEPKLNNEADDAATQSFR